MEVQPQLVLLQKTLLNIEGLGRTLDPDLDLWETGKTFLELLMKISQDVRDYAAAQGVSETEAVQRGMAEKSIEFVKSGAEVYHRI